MANFAEALVSTFLPASCALCHRELPWEGSRAGVCASCWGQAEPHSRLGCPSCGDPDAEGEPCLSCRAEPPAWDAATSHGTYGGALRGLVLLFKSAGRDELATPLGRLLVKAVARVAWPAPDMVVPVPMWWPRRLRRGYNQAELLARKVAGDLGAPLVAALRREGGAPQAGRSRVARMLLSSGSFTLRHSVRGRVLLVDDVLTTGATASACTRVLRRAGAREVCVLTVARTPRPGRIP